MQGKGFNSAKIIQNEIKSLINDQNTIKVMPL